MLRDGIWCSWILSGVGSGGLLGYKNWELEVVGSDVVEEDVMDVRMCSREEEEETK